MYSQHNLSHSNPYNLLNFLQVKGVEATKQKTLIIMLERCDIRPASVVISMIKTAGRHAGRRIYRGSEENK
jgi:hypothetical protein